MNKVFSVNIGGLAFSIDDMAYEKLSKYLSSIRQHFSNTEGREEIVSDIESRIAEILREKLKPGKEIINMEDVDYIIAAMGSPEDFAGSEEEETRDNTNYSSQQSYHGSHSWGKRLFRDPDNKVVGGVCTGISAYFGIHDPIWIRLIFIILVVMGIGSGLVLYVVLWIAIPKARTVTDRMEMRGEDVTINNIKKNINEEYEELKENFSKFKSSSRGQKFENGAHSFSHFIVEALHLIGKVFLKIFAVLMVFWGIFFLVVLIFMSLGLSESLSDIPHLISSSEKANWTMIGIAIMIGIPLLLLIIKGCQMLFNFRIRSSVLNIIFLVAWIGGLGITIFAGISYAQNFSQKSSSSREFSFKPAKSDTLYLDILRMEKGKTLSHIGIHLNDDEPFLGKDEDRFIIQNVSLKVEKSRDSQFHFVEIMSSRGASSISARTNTQEIDYQYNLTNNNLVLDAYCSFPQKSAWRNQKVRLILKVPEGKTLFFSNNMKHFLDDVKNTTDTYDEDMLGHYWKMNGEELKCLDCTEEQMPHRHRRHARPNKEDYSYSFNL